MLRSAPRSSTRAAVLLCKEKEVNKRLDPDKLVTELAAARALIEGHENMQLLLDFAADEADRRAVEQEHLRRVAWRVAGGFAGVAFVAMAIAAGAVATSMRPAPPPKVLVVDKAEGVVQPLMSLADFQISPEEATIRRNVNTFVLAREGYSYEQADTHYYTTAAFLGPQLQTQWSQIWDKSNPDSPPNRYKKEHRVRVKVGAITVLRNGLGAPIGARASFTKTELVNDIPDGQPTYWIANISFHWVNQPTNERDRRINDLGWEVTDYTADRDLSVPKSVSTEPAPQGQQRPAGSQMALVAPGNDQKASP
jgi:type IV secretion system protein VirB8